MRWHVPIASLLRRGKWIERFLCASIRSLSVPLSHLLATGLTF